MAVTDSEVRAAKEAADRLLRQAAFLWLIANPEPPRPYSTSGNSFLDEAESAYFAVVGHSGRDLVTA